MPDDKKTQFELMLADEIMKLREEFINHSKILKKIDDSYKTLSDGLLASDMLTKYLLQNIIEYDDKLKDKILLDLERLLNSIKQKEDNAYNQAMIIRANNFIEELEKKQPHLLH